MKIKEVKEKKETFRERLQKYVNNRCTIKVHRKKDPNIKYTNEGVPVGTSRMMGLGKNYAVVFFSKRTKLKGWQKELKRKIA
jgi:hypothetical protein